MNNIDEICCLSMGRTGTNYLCSLLDSIDNIMSMREIFSFNKCYVPKYIDDELKKKLAFTNDREIVSYAHSYPKKFMNILREIKTDLNKDYMFYKIFITSWQITTQQLENIFYNNKHTCFIFMTRNILKIFISLRKAQQLDKWSMCNTTDIKIKFNGKDFMEYFALFNSLQETIHRLCKKYNKKLLEIKYEEFTKFDTDLDRLKFVSDKLNEKFQIKLNIDDNIKTSYFKQDKSLLKDTISNYNEMVVFLNENNLNYLI